MIFGRPSLAGVEARLRACRRHPVYAISSLYLNISKKHQIEAEFQRRASPCPRRSTPGEEHKASFSSHHPGRSGSRCTARVRCRAERVCRETGAAGRPAFGPG